MNEDQEAAVEFREEETRVEERSSGFKKELGLTDLVLTQILFIVGLPWVGVAAKQGPSHVVLWLGGDRAFLHSVGVRGDLSQPGDAARGRTLSMGKARFQRSRRLYGRVEPVAFGDPEHIGGRASGDAIYKLYNGPRQRMAECKARGLSAQ